MGPTERDKFLRCAWQVMVAKEIDAGRFVFVNECGTNTSLSPLYAWAPKGRRARSSVPRNWGTNITLLASVTANGTGPSLADEGAMRREVFEAYLERFLVPSLRPGQAVVMDNLSVQMGGRVSELIEQRGYELLYLRPYSPDLNPIEEASSKTKGLMRKAEVRTREALIEAMDRALAAVTAEDARGFFGHRGYRHTGQLL